ncbi:MAG: DUF4239 domain-containing protein [Deltaproteobacteria bacterium]|nr:DUF4239 domain-containing protein [Deltaproteobacteria bacterium]
MTPYLAMALFVIVSLFLGILLFVEIGRRIGLARHAEEPEGARPGIAAIDGAVFALMGLLIAFTFSGAASRFDTRRHLIVEETNAIGTAWLRIDLLGEPQRAALQAEFRAYVDARMEVYRKLPDFAAALEQVGRAGALGQHIWASTVSACKAQSGVACFTVLLPAINQMLDIATTRTAAAEMHPPTAIFLMLLALLLVSSFLAGYEMSGGKSRNWIHTVSYALIMSMAVYLIADLEFPRLGLIRIEKADHFLDELRESMG